MTERVKKQQIITRLAARMDTNEAEATLWLDAVTETLYEAISAGESVTLPGFGGFYVKARADTWTFKFNPSQRLRSALGWSSTYAGD
jgi:DNA-binding protein HU-beta